jgi:hypothetical protein
MNIYNMKKIFFSFLALTMALASCDIDNYDAPDAGIYGYLIDAESGDTVYTEQPDGAHIRLMDMGYQNPTPLDFWAKADGSFRNVALFSGSYKAYPYEGPFFPVEEETVVLKGITHHDFKVVPFIKVHITSVTQKDSSLVVNYTLMRSETPEGMTMSRKSISEVQVLINTHPIVSIYNGGFTEGLVKKRILSRTSDAILESTEQSTAVPGIKPGQKYYVRVAALSNNQYNSALKRYNYSKIVEFTAE